MKPYLMLLVTNFIVTVQGKTFRAHLDTSKSFHFVGRFGFAVSPKENYVGHVRYRITYPKKYASSLRLLLFYNGTAESPWNKIYNDQTSCSERRAAAASRTNAFAVASPSDMYRVERFWSVMPDKEKEELITYQSILPFATSRPRYFYIALTNCPATCQTQACDSPLSNIRFIFQAGNFYGDRDLLSEFSYGDRWFLPLYIMAFMASCVVNVYALYVSFQLSKTAKFHITVWLLISSVFCFGLGALFKMLHFVIYANGGIGGKSAPIDADFANLVKPHGLARANLWKYGIPFEQGWLDKLYPGIGIWELNAAGEFLYMLSDYFMLYKLILVAKGLTITRRRLSSKSIFRVPIYMTIYFLAYITYLIVNEITYDEGVYKSKYGSPMGIFLVILRVGIGIFFFRSVCYTIYKFGSKRGFYRKFVLFGVAWIWVFPLVLLICGIMILAGVGPSSTMHIDGVLTFFIIMPTLVIQIGMLLMYDPSCRFNKKFPFHAEVTEMKKIRNARIKIVGGDKDEEEGELVMPRYVNMSEKQLAALHKKIDQATFRLERVNEAVDFLQTEIDDLEAIGFADDTKLDDVPEAEAYELPKPERKGRRRRNRRGNRDESDEDRDRDDGSDNESNADSGGRRQRRRRTRRRSDSDE